MRRSRNTDIFTPDDYRQFAIDCDHIVKTIDQTRSLKFLNGVDAMIEGLAKKYTKYHGLLRASSTQIADPSSFIYLREKLYERRRKLTIL
jgi:hypothetical protein